MKSLRTIKAVDPQEQEWRARDDARTLRSAIEIQQDEERLERALKVEAEQAAQSEALLSAYRKKPDKKERRETSKAAQQVKRVAQNIPPSFADKISIARGLI